MATQEYFQLNQNGKMGIKRLDGTVVIPPKYDYAATLSDGVFLIGDGGKHSYFDVGGNPLFPFENRYKNYCDFSEGLAAVDTGKLYGYIDKTGKEVIAPQFRFAEFFCDGVAVVRNNEGLHGVINKQGELLVDYKYIVIGNFNEGYAPFGDGQTWGIMDTKGNEILPQRYPFIGKIENGQAVVQVIEANGDYKEGLVTLASGKIAWNNNMDAVNEQSRKRKDFTEKCEVLVKSFYQDGCPCERPRFRNYIQHEGALVHADKEWLYAIFEENLKQVSDSGFACRCGTVYERNFQEFSLDFGVLQVKISKLGSFTEKGSPVPEKIPFSLGFQGHDLGEIPDNAIQTDNQAVIAYLKG